jgi:hypothetical protein
MNVFRRKVDTCPAKVNGRADFVLIHRAIQRWEIETTAACYAGFYVFGTNDLKVNSTIHKPQSIKAKIDCIKSNGFIQFVHS